MNGCIQERNAITFHPLQILYKTTDSEAEMSQSGRARDSGTNGPGSSVGHSTFFGQIWELVKVKNRSEKTLRLCHNTCLRM